MKQYRSRNLITVKRSDKIIEALSLPKVLSMNPRSIYNKLAEFVTFVKEEEVSLICISESWERKEKPLEQVIRLENHKIISNVHQRHGPGGRPAIIADTTKYDVENITQTVVTIPWGVEAVWAILTPKNTKSSSTIQKIIIGSIYCKPNSKKKTILYDHISQVYNQLSSKYPKGLHWIICGDTNDLKLDPILHLNKNLRQVVQDPTRLSPPRILDPIITTLSGYYQKPKCLKPLDADLATKGKPSDHLMVVMEPVSVLNNESTRTRKEIIYRPFKEEYLQQMWEWIRNEKWDAVSHEGSAHKKASVLQQILLDKYHEYFPEKRIIISSDDQPYFSGRLSKLKRRKNREYNKHRKSKKWEEMNVAYVKELLRAKREFYGKKIKHLRKAKPKHWYRELKKLTSFDQHESGEIVVESLKDLPSKQQAEIIADKFAEVSQEYEEIKAEQIEVPKFNEEDIPLISENEVISTMLDIDASKSSVKKDIPAKILKKFAHELGKPDADILN